MRHLTLAVLMALGLGVYALAQTRDNQLLRVGFIADYPTSSDGRLAHETLKGRRLTVRGNVEIYVNDVRVTADSATYFLGGTLITLNDGASRIELPRSPDVWAWRVRIPGAEPISSRELFANQKP